MVSPQRVRMMLMSTISSPSISGLAGNNGESSESENLFRLLMTWDNGELKKWETKLNVVIKLETTEVLVVRSTYLLPPPKRIEEKFTLCHICSSH